MSDNVIPVGNTPIFDQMVQEMAARGKRFESLLSPSGTANLKLVEVWGISAQEAGQNLKDGLSAMPSASEIFWTAGSWITDPVPVINPKISETFNPSELIEQAINPQLHIQQIVKKFTAKWPGVTPVHITRLDNIDGTVTIVVSKAEMVAQTDESVNAGPKPAVVKHLSEVRPTNVPDMITTSKIDFEKERLEYFRDVPVTPEMQRTVDGKCDPKYQQTSIEVSSEIAGVKIPETTKTFSEILYPAISQTSIGEDVADTLYMKPSAWGSNEE